MNTWTKEEDLFLMNNHNKMTSKEMENYIGHTWRAIQMRIQNLGLSQNKCTPWTDEEINFLRNNYERFSNEDLGKQINRSRSSIQNKLTKLGLVRSDKYTYNIDFFEKIDTEEKAYWYGFILADGYVAENDKARSRELSIQLAVRDIEHLKKFNKSIGGNVEVSIFTKKGESLVKKDHKMCAIRLYSKKIVKDIEKYGCVPNKTYKDLHIPDIDENLIIHFIRGFFDGDGSICLDKSRKKEKDWVRCDFTNASLTLLNEIREYLYSVGIRSYICCESKKNGSTIPIYRLLITCRTDAYEFLEMLYNDATIFLDRKHNFYAEKKKDLELEERYLKKRRITQLKLPLR